MRRILLLSFASAWTFAFACGETDPSPATNDAGGKADATAETGAATQEASTPDVSTGTPDTSVVDAVVADTSVPDVQNDTSTAVDSGPCPIGVDDTVSASIKVDADDFLTLWVNGVFVANKTTTWPTVDTHPITLFRHPSRKNVIAIEARNAYNTSGLDRAVIADATITFPQADGGADAAADAGVLHVVTDVTWKLFAVGGDAGALVDAGGDAGVPGWATPAFDDSSWVAPVDLGGNPLAPWSSVTMSPQARWLWSYNSSSVASKPASETILIRKTVYFAPQGSASATPVACP